MSSKASFTRVTEDDVADSKPDIKTSQLATQEIAQAVIEEVLVIIDD